MIVRRARRALVIAVCAGSLGACVSGSSTGFRETIGLDRRSPDEFLVMSKAPLVVPPNMNLRPPAPGAPPANQTDTRDLARSAIAGPRSGGGGASSAGEQAILARANAGEADPNVRAELLREQGIETVDQTVADQVMALRREEAQRLDANAEAQRLRNEIGSGQQAAQPATGAEPQAEPGGGPTSILLEDILGGN